MSNSLTFIVLTYNHTPFILEHLESIKFQIETYGIGWEVDIIIADDFSKDTTVSLSNLWLDENRPLFRTIKVISDGFNRGTCKNLLNAVQYMSSDYCKITAGDDVYSYENLFSEFQKIDHHHLLSGLPLNLINGTILDSRFELFNLFSTNVIYQNDKFFERLKKINFFNAPSIVYSVDTFKNNEITKFLSQFSVTEDYPLQIKMAEFYKPLKLIQIKKIFIYYRRTENSTYIIKNTSFDRDKLAIFDYLISKEESIWNKFLLKNRKFCHQIKNKYIKKILNLNVYIYGFNVLMNIKNIYNVYSKFQPDIKKHQNHYDLISFRAKEKEKKYLNKKKG